jgi:hypothetical protein
MRSLKVARCTIPNTAMAAPRAVRPRTSSPSLIRGSNALVPSAKTLSAARNVSPRRVAPGAIESGCMTMPSNSRAVAYDTS